MVNTAVLCGATLATMTSVVFVTASETELGMDSKVVKTNNTDKYGTLITDTSEGTPNHHNLITEEELDFDNEISIAEKKSCRATEKCILFGGFCVKSRAECDGIVDQRECRGKKCKCCVPVPPCSTTTSIVSSTTTVDTSTTSATTAKQDQCEFEEFNGRLIRRTISSDTKSDYDGCMSFCDQCGAKPFIPRTEADYQLYKEVRTALGNNSAGIMWLPANDRQEEGTLRWYNGEVASNIELWDWNQGQVLFYNSDLWDCLFYGHNTYVGPIVYMAHDNNFDAVYPPICERI